VMEFRPVEEVARLAELKRQYMEQTTAPLDGMWLCGFVPQAKHYGVYFQAALAGYCCVNGDGYLLQYFLSPQYRERSSELLTRLLRDEDVLSSAVEGAFVSTAEPESLSLYLDHFSAFKVSALMYQLDGVSRSVNQTADGSLPALAPIDTARLAETVEFAIAAIGAPEEWLTGYYANLIFRGELFGVWDEGRLVATGESRAFDEYQTSYAELGVIVAESARGRGLGTNVLKLLVAMNDAKGLKSICSTETENVAAQKAIVWAGFFAGNRIVRFER
jgi:RimJ/RimL family protein N-acetyltransferase